MIWAWVCCLLAAAPFLVAQGEKVVKSIRARIDGRSVWLPWKSGTSWALLRRELILDLDSDAVYIERFRLIQSPMFGVLVHRICLPDTGRPLHSHPWSAIGMILKGGYDELRLGGMRRRRRFSLGCLRTTTVHSIEALHRTPTWTVMVIGPRHADGWGFLVNGEIMESDDYIARHKSGWRPEVLSGKS